MASPNLRSLPDDLAELFPRWTAWVATDSRIRDPLGFSALSHRLTDLLLPGITTNTYWARYYAIYCWILWHIGESGAPTSESHNAVAFQRREVAFAMATLLDPSFKIKPLGSDPAEKSLAAGDTVSLDIRLRKNTRYGGFASTYMGSMAKMGLWSRPTPIREEVTPGIATDLARAVDASIRHTPFVRNELWRAPRIPRAELEGSVVMSLGAVRSDVGAGERRLLVDLMFAFDPRVGAAGLRPQSLTLMLWLLAAYDAAGLDCPIQGNDGGWRDEYLLYAPFYAGALRSATGDVPLGPVPGPLRACADLWRTFCAQQYMTYACEQLFAAVLTALGSDSSGMSIDAVVRVLTGREFERSLAAATGVPCKRPERLLAVFASSLVAPPAGHRGPFSEYTRLVATCDSAPALLANALLLLGILGWRIERHGAPLLPAGMYADGHLHAGDVPQLVRSWGTATATWPGVVRELISKLSGHHQVVLASRGSATSPWLTLDGVRLIPEGHKVKADTRSSRLWPTVHILRDLLLVKEIVRAGVPCWKLTSAGRSIITRSLGRWS